MFVYEKFSIIVLSVLLIAGCQGGSSPVGNLGGGEHERDTVKTGDHDDHGSETDSHHDHHVGEEEEKVIDLSQFDDENFTFEAVQSTPYQAFYTTTGRIELNPNLQAKVSSPIGGMIDRLNVSEGDRVREGDLIATISSPKISEMVGKLHEAELEYVTSSRDLERERKSLKKSDLVQVALLEAESSYNESVADLEVLNSDLNKEKKQRQRVEQLEKDGIVSKKERESQEAIYQATLARQKQAEKSVALAKKNLQRQKDLKKSQYRYNERLIQAESDFKLAEHHVEHISEQLNFYQVEDGAMSLKAPISGIVYQQKVVRGEAVEPGDLFFELIDTKNLWVRVHLMSSLFGKVSRGQLAKISLADQKGPSYEGKILSISPKLDPQTKTSEAVVSVQNRDGSLLPGMLAEIAIASNSVAGELPSVSDKALLDYNGNPAVFVRESDNRVALHRVEIASRYKGRVWISKGLKAGDEVVIEGAFSLKSHLEIESFEGHVH